MKQTARKLRVAWFSPLNFPGRTTPSISAYASEHLLPILRERFEIDLFHQGFEVYQDFPTYNYLSAFAHHRREPYDVLFYQIEDTRLSNFLRVHMGLMPGVVWFHDLVFSSFGPEPILNSPWRQVVLRFNGRDEPWPARAGEFEQQGPLGFRESAWSVVPVFSNPVALDEYRRNIELQLRCEQTRHQGHFVPIPVPGRDIERRPHEHFTLIFAGSPRIEHRAHKILQALSELGGSVRLRWLIGRDETGAARSLLDEFSIGDAELVEGRTPERWRQLLETADCAAHTHFSVYGQPEPYLSMSLMAGLPALVTHFGPAEYLPESIVFKIQAGSQEVFQIREVLAALGKGIDPRVREQIRNFAWSSSRAEVCASELAAVFMAESERLARFSVQWDSFEEQARQELVREARDLADGDDIWDRLLRPGFEELGWL